MWTCTRVACCDSLCSPLGLPTAEALAITQELLVQEHECVPAVEVPNRLTALATADSDDPVLHRHTREAIRGESESGGAAGPRTERLKSCPQEARKPDAMFGAAVSRETPAVDDDRRAHRCRVVRAVPWCEILVDSPDGDEERTLMRQMRDIPAAGDLIDVDGEKVLVTSVSQVPPRKTPRGRDLSVLIHCRAP